jgi:DHA2 family multidrug resistance protein
MLRWILFIRGIGVGFAMMPVMTYALASVPQQMTAQASALINVCRTIFASLGIAVFATLLDTFQKTNLSMMVQTITPDSVIALQVLSQMQVYFMQLGMTLEAARQAAVTYLFQYINLRASVTAFQMDYVIGALVVLAGIIPAMFLPFGRIKKSGARAMPME